MTTTVRRLAVALTTGALIVGTVAAPAAGHALKGAPKADRRIHAREHVQIAKARQAARVKLAKLARTKVKPAKAKAARARVAKVRAAKIKAAKTRAARARAAAAKARKAARFVATGTVIAADADTVTVTVSGGYRDLHGTTQTFVVSGATKITRDGATAGLGDIQPGDAVMVKGARTGWAATHVSATSPPVVDEPVDELDEEIVEP